MDRSRKKGPALIVLLAVAGAFTALGISLDEEVLPTSPDTQQLVRVTAVQSSLSQRRTQSADASEPSEVLQQLSRAIEAANQSESDSASQLEERMTASRRLIDETNRLLEERGASGKGDVESAKRQEFNQKFSELESRLTELKVPE
jgi:hypothetical protein